VPYCFFFSFLSLGEQTLGEDALEGLSLVINIFGLEQRRIMAQMHQEIQLLISVFIISVSADQTPLLSISVHGAQDSRWFLPFLPFCGRDPIPVQYRLFRA
jgi:hypothetical protein